MNGDRLFMGWQRKGEFPATLGKVPEVRIVAA